MKLDPPPPPRPRQGPQSGGGGDRGGGGVGMPGPGQDTPLITGETREGPGQVRGGAGRLSVSNPTESLKSGQGREVGHREGSSIREEGWK